MIKFFKEVERELGFSKEHLNVLNCFLDPKHMIKEEEVPNPLNPNAEVLEYTADGRIKPKQPSSNVQKVDPIWEFFNPRNAREGSQKYTLIIKMIVSLQIHLRLTCVML